MSIDGYSACPCHIEKKIKFCCGKDVLHDLNEAVEKSQSGQVVAAIDQLDRAIKKLGPRDCLVTMKTHLLLNSGRTKEAKETNREFVARNPDNFMGRQIQALICSAERDLEGAITALQDALDILDQSGVDSLPVSLATPLKIVGIMLLQQANPIAARIYLLIASELKNNQDPEILQMLMYAYKGPGIPTFLRRSIDMDLLDSDDREWVRSYNNAVKLVRRGQFRLANRLLKKLDEIAPDQREIINGLVLTHFCLNQPEEADQQLYRMARLGDIPHEAAIESEVLAQHFDPEARDLIDSTILGFELTDVARAFELLDGCNKTIALHPEQAHVLRDNAPPKHAFAWLSRPLDEVPADSDLDELAEILATICIYGKRTDRPALMLVGGEATPEFQANVEEIKNLVSDLVDGEPKLIQSIPDGLEKSLMTVHAVPPKDSGERSYSYEDVHRHVIRTRLLETPLKVFSGKTAREFAASLPSEERIRLDGWIFRTGLSNFAIERPFDLIEVLYQELNVEPPPPVPDDRFNEALHSPIRARLLDLSKLDVDQLSTVLNSIEATHDSVLAEKCLRELLKRDSEKAQQLRPTVLAHLAQMTQDGQEALSMIREARKLALANGQPIGLLLVTEFDLSMGFGHHDGITDLLQLIVTRHLDEPGVAEALAAVLEQHGIAPDGLNEFLAALPTRETAPPRSQTPAAPASSPGIWTPDQPAAPVAPPADTDEKKSTLWIPGQD